MSEPVFAVTRSSLPSVFRSPSAADFGLPPAGSPTCRESPVAFPQQHAHRVRAGVRGNEVQPAVAVHITQRTTDGLTPVG